MISYLLIIIKQLLTHKGTLLVQFFKGIVNENS